MQLQSVEEDLDCNFIAIVLLPLFLYTMYLTTSYVFKQSETVLRIALFIGVGLAFAASRIRRILGLMERKRRLLLGLQGKISTDEELNLLMLDGCRVFHDVPMKEGNIDHVVVSPLGVGAVETKMRGKPRFGNDKATLIVDYDQNLLRFPDRVASIPKAQLESQRRWLSEFLSSAVGEPFAVTSVLAFPGWYAQTIGMRPEATFVINPYKSQHFFCERTFAKALGWNDLSHRPSA